ncbi:MAG TPA: TonB family protein [Desulfuromonadaceae bacterium]
MSDRYIEKSFLYLLVVSLLIHVGVFALLYYLPEAKQQRPKEPVFIDLSQMPELKPQRPTQQEVKRFSDQRMRVEREMAPRGTSPRETAPAPAPQRPSVRSQPSPPQREAGRTAPQPPLRPGSSMSSLLRPRQQVAQLPRQQLFPGANRMAKLEDTYRHKFEDDVAQGDTRFLNSDDILFGSFLRRFETAVYGVWRYPAEAANNGIEGITPVKITFNREGKIIHVQLLESSGSRILDDEVLRTLREVGPVGSFPKGYTKDEFHLIAFFQYGGSRRSLR